VERLLWPRKGIGDSRVRISAAELQRSSTRAVGPMAGGVAGYPRRMGRARQRHHRWLGRGESLFPAQKRLLLLLLPFQK
jgi:hypothetical protein